MDVWKEYLRQYDADTAKGRPAIDLADALTRVFNDIEEHGLTEGSAFSDGWVCPVYKKKDKREVGNYRPITVLNADYKAMTRAIAMRLAECAGLIIHPDQAGFVPGRSIYDHVRLTELMTTYAEAEEINGVIVALDQEKAYDRIDHTYLWAAMRHANMPENLIHTVQSLYRGARSCVLVNGAHSSFMSIVRGVRQGDPMSCLLFNIAIEPLAAALRNSDLRGFRLPGTDEKLIAKLFADDTTVYLSEQDNYADLQTVTQTWCDGRGPNSTPERLRSFPLARQSTVTEWLTPESRALTALLYRPGPM